MSEERWHGTFGGYTNHACRCAECTRANTEKQRDYMSRHPEQVEKHHWRSREYEQRPEVKARRVRRNREYYQRRKRGQEEAATEATASPEPSERRD